MTATKKALETKGSEKELAPQKEVAITPEKFSPFVEAEKLLERMAEMTLQTADKAYDFFRMRGGEWGKELDDWFNAEREVLRPVPVGIKEVDNNIIVNAAVPGFLPDEIEVSVKDNLLILTGEAKAHEEKKDEKWIVKEWTSDRFLRQFTLPANVDASNAHARLTNGMLELTLPKAAVETPKKIEVEAG